jgi:hypothetical protein
MKCTDDDGCDYSGVGDDDDDNSVSDFFFFFLLFQVPSIEEWLLSELHPGDLISADPRIISYREWTNWDSYFSKISILSYFIYEMKLVF